MEIVATPGTVLGLAQHGDEVFALVRIDGPTRPPNARLMRLEGDSFVPVGLEGPAPATRFARGPDGPWLVIGVHARALASFGSRDLGVGGEVAFAGGDPIVASLGGRLQRVGAWECLVKPERIGYPGVRQIRRDTSWQPEPVPPWTPLRWEPFGAPLVTGGMVVAGFYEPQSGLGVRCACALDDGRLLWTTDPAPMGEIAVYAEGEVVIGSQGYGAFTSELRDASPAPIVSWPTHGAGIAFGDGVVIVELDNANAGSGRVVRVHRRGVVEQGPVLPGYYTSRPAVRGDAIVFARGDGLWRVDRALGVEKLVELPGDEVWHGPTLVLSDGTVIVAGYRAQVWRVPYMP